MSSAGWKDIKYRQDLPPPGGYGTIPYKRNIPVRGSSGAVLIGVMLAIHGLAYHRHNRRIDYTYLVRRENCQGELCYYPLLEAERDRALMRDRKEHIESEALNIVGTGFDPDYVPGGHGIFHVERFDAPRVRFTDTFFFGRIRDWYDTYSTYPRCGP